MKMENNEKEDHRKFVNSKEFMHLCFEEAGYCESLTSLYEYIDTEKYYTPFELEVKKAVYGD